MAEPQQAGRPCRTVPLKLSGGTCTGQQGRLGLVCVGTPEGQEPLDAGTCLRHAHRGPRADLVTGRWPACAPSQHIAGGESILSRCPLLRQSTPAKRAGRVRSAEPHCKRFHQQLGQRWAPLHTMRFFQAALAVNSIGTAVIAATNSACIFWASSRSLAHGPKYRGGHKVLHIDGCLS